MARLIGARDDPSQDRLNEAVHAAIKGGEASVLILGLHRPRRSIITVRPAREQGLAVVRIDDLDGAAQTMDRRQLTRGFGLPPAEAEVALGLLRGSSLRAIALQRGVALETVRTQVKSLLRRVGVANQKQLMATLSQLSVAWQNATAMQAEDTLPPFERLSALSRPEPGEESRCA